MATTAEQLKALVRWIKASILIEIRKTTEGKALFVEGDDRLTSKEQQHLEFRLDGPYVSPHGTTGEYRAYIEVNILANSTRNEKNRWSMEELRGISLAMLSRDFCIYRVGRVNAETIDDETLVGLMQLMPSEQIKLSDFGRIDPASETYQAVAEAHYEMFFNL
jgi:hypothetical protein